MCVVVHVCIEVTTFVTTKTGQNCQGFENLFKGNISHLIVSF